MAEQLIILDPTEEVFGKGNLFSVQTSNPCWRTRHCRTR